MFNLRPYQITGKAECSEAFGKHQAVVLCMPTGSGKTVTFADITLDAITNGVPTMILCNRRELIDQAKDKLNSFGLYPTVIDPSYRNGTVSNLYLASVDTLRNRTLPDIGLLIVDEAHIRSFDEIVLIYKSRGTYIIGCTATPVRYGKKFLEDFPEYTGHLGDIYTKIIEPITITELLKNEWLVPAVHYGAEVDLSQLKKAGEEFSEKSLFETYNKPKMYADVIGKYNKLTPNTKAIVFNVNVEHSKRMNAEFNAAGIRSVHLDGKEDKKTRKRILKDYSLGVYQVLNNCGIATTGYDEPSIETVIINRAINSLSLFLQIPGRGSRLYPGKYWFNVIDMGSNVARHGYWHDEREYSLDKKYVSKKLQPSIVITCENCEALIPSNSSSCPHCKQFQERAEARKAEEQELLDAEFVVLDNIMKKPLGKMSVVELERYRTEKKYQVGWVVRQLIARGESALVEYQQMKNYAPAWVKMQLRQAQEIKQKSLDNIWTFMTDNTHLELSDIEQYALRKLKANHTPSEVMELMPKILEAKKNL